MNGPTYKEEPIKKLYFGIDEIAKEVNVHTSAIRYWCKEFCINPKRSRNTNKRLFDLADKIRIREIYFLLYIEGYTLRGAKKKLELL